MNLKEAKEILNKNGYILSENIEDIIPSKIDDEIKEGDILYDVSCYYGRFVTFYKVMNINKRTVTLGVMRSKGGYGNGTVGYVTPNIDAPVESTFTKRMSTVINKYKLWDGKPQETYNYS